MHPICQKVNIRSFFLRSFGEIYQDKNSGQIPTLKT